MRRIFWGFSRNWLLIDPLHYLLSCSAFGFEFAEIFLIEKRLSDLAGQKLPDSPSRRVGDSMAPRIVFDYKYLREFEAKIGTARNVV